jgi:4-hydroxy-tetrahydrodipicolinate reductase
VLLSGSGETVELTHRVHDRSVFARGALRAARFLRGRAPGRYGMDDLLA